MLFVYYVSAVITPPDVVTQIMMALPLMILYEISIVGARIFGKKAIMADEDEEREETEPS